MNFGIAGVRLGLAIVSVALTVIVRAGSPITVATGDAEILIASTGNLYWISNFIDELGPTPFSSAVFRTSKTATPGSERQIYAEVPTANQPAPLFGPFVYAKTNVWYGFLVVSAGSASYIKRITLASGNATLFVTSPAGSRIRDLVTDGANLYWSDTTGVRRIAVSGGPITVLATIAEATKLRLDTRFVYFSAADRIHRVSKNGSAVTTPVVATSTVSDFYVRRTPARTTIYWSEENASVRSRVVGVAGQTTYQQPIANTRVSSVAFDGTRVFWIDCTSPGNSYCRLRRREGDTIKTIVETAGVGARNLVFDASSIFWIATGDVKKISR